jgi:hypothetical protein
MEVVVGRFTALFGRPEFLRSFHGWLTLLWGLLIPITVFTGLKGSIVWIALMSVWANFVGHFSSWQAARVEVKQDEQIDDVSGPQSGSRGAVPVS